MFYNLYEYVHSSLGLHFWDPLTLLLAVILAVMVTVHSRNQKKREDDFEEARKEKLEAVQKGLAES
ncbi:MAG: hypothetical protein HFI38_01430 [Lachnospiraceae bacterium]|jgi:hypothetical protein|nr:hypothetical protein [Lachnospiraceae bacterium]